MSHFHNNALIGASGQGGGYNITDSLRFRSSASAYLNRTPASAGNRKTWTWSAWIKKGSLSTNQNLFSANGVGTIAKIILNSNNTIDFQNNVGSVQLTTTPVYRDPSAWYHIIVVYDTPQATASNRTKIYVNGSQVTALTNAVYPAQNSDGVINDAILHTISRESSAVNFFDGYMAEVNFVDGQALTPSDFGEFNPQTGVWQPIEYTGSYGTNGFYLPMKETQQATGFNTVTYNGNGTELKVTGVGFNPDLVWVKRRDNSASYYRLIDSVRGGDKRLASNDTGGETTASTLIQSFDADGYTVGTDTGMNASGDRYVAWCWDATSDNTTGSELVTNGTFDSNTTGWTNVNSSISGANQKLNATYTSSGAYVYQEVTGLTVGQKYMLSFQSSGSNDFIRILRNAQTEALGGTFISFLGGNTITKSGLNQVFFEAPTTTVYINFNVPNGGTIIIDDISLKQVSYDGTIPSYTKTNTSTGFSIVSYTGTGATATVGHGLTSAPDIIIIKNRIDASGWIVYNSTIGNTKYLALNSQVEASLDGGVYWNATSPTSSVFTVNTSNSVNGSGDGTVAYCFSEVAGYSKFGSYTGNGSASGPTVTTGFRPAFVLIKNSSSANHWLIWDNTRNPFNPINLKISPSTTTYENDPNILGGLATNTIDFTDTGFQITGTHPMTNTSGGTYIYMAFADTRDYQWNFDASGNKNNWTPANINSNASSETTYDLMSDTPSLADEDTANFCTLSPLSGGLAPYNANLSINQTAGSWNATPSTFTLNTGKWYFESGSSALGPSNYHGLGLRPVGMVASGEYCGSISGSYGGIAGPTVFNAYSGGVLGSNVSGTYTSSSVFQCAVDFDAGKIWFGDGTSWIGGGSPSAGTTPSYTFTANTPLVPYISAYASAPSVNFGQRPFKYTPPTGFKKLNTYNLPDSSIKDGSQYFNTVTYTGTGASRDITVGFSPDLVWVKNRTSAYQHQVSDSVRGTSTVLYPSATTAEASDPNAVTAFLSDGFTYGSSVNGNQSSASIVAWNWRGSDSAAVTNTDGTITSTVSANPTSGFSVVTFTGTGATGTVGHGLSQAPEIYIRKSRSNVEDWLVYTTLIDGSLDFLRLNTTSPKADSGASLPNATTFEVGAGEANGELLVTYCFHSVEGFSKMGTYTGNGSADGTFVYTGFRPAFVLTKSATEARQWVIIDTSRDPYNLANKNQEITSSVEFTNADDLDILSNGFKPRTNNPGANGNGQTIIYMAFAENPFKNTLAR